VILYLDSSALLKLFVSEPGSEAVNNAVAGAGAVATHLIAYAEMRATFAKAERMRRVDAAGLKQILAEFELRWARMDVLAATEPLVRRAGDLAHRHGLRGYDSVHLAAVLALRDAAGGQAEVRFGVFDVQLRQAAFAHDVSLLPAD